MLNLLTVCRVISRSLFIVAFAFAGCAALAWNYQEAPASFLLALAFTSFLSICLFLVGRFGGEQLPVQRKDAYLAVALSWLLMSLVGSLPFILSGSIPRPVDAFFEAVSGFTTTGASILTDIEALPRSVLFWRSLTHWIGGIGIIALVIVIMPTLQIGGYHLFMRESSLSEKIRPKIKSVGYRLLLIYVGLTAAEVVMLLLGRMSPFESFCHAFGTVSTGGFSPRNTSIAGYSPYIQYMVMLFMLFGGTNFLIFYCLLKGDFRRIAENEELRFYLLMVGGIGAVIAGALHFGMHKPLEESVRESYFQVVSIITCTGFATADYLLWPAFAWTLIFFSMFLGGSTGSTAGGIKMARHLVLLKNVRRLFRMLLSRNAVISVSLNGNHVTEDGNRSIMTYILVYFVTFLAGSAALLAAGLDGMTSSSAVATCMAGIGPGLGTVGPVSNFAHLPDSAKIVLSFLMLAGRLELYTLIILFSRSFWRTV